MPIEKKRGAQRKLPLIFLLVAALAAGYAAVLHIFVFNSGFAPMGVDGIATMVQFLTGFNAGYTGLIANLPLLVLAWFFLNRKYVVYTLVFAVSSNLFLLLYAQVNLYQYVDPNGNYIMAALFGGIIRGGIAGIILLMGGSTGGVDIVVSLIQKRFEHISFDRIFLFLNLVVIAASFFVYGQDLNPILLAVISAFSYSKLIEVVLKGPKSALEFKIVTEHADELRQAILTELRHGVTVIPVVGGYTDGNKTMLIAVVNPREVAVFKRIIKRFDKTFAYYGNVGDVIGNFRRGQNEEVK